MSETIDLYIQYIYIDKYIYIDNMIPPYSSSYSATKSNIYMYLHPYGNPIFPLLSPYICYTDACIASLLQLGGSSENTGSTRAWQLTLKYEPICHV